MPFYGQIVLLNKLGSLCLQKLGHTSPEDIYRKIVVLSYFERIQACKIHMMRLYRKWHIYPPRIQNMWCSAQRCYIYPDRMIYKMSPLC